MEERGVGICGAHTKSFEGQPVEVTLTTSAYIH